MGTAVQRVLLIFLFGKQNVQPSCGWQSHMHDTSYHKNNNKQVPTIKKIPAVLWQYRLTRTTYLLTMDTQRLLAVNNYGKIFTLSASNDQWQPFPHVGMDLKHVSAVENYIWSIGGDNQTYLLVYNLSETIRIKEEIYENEVGILTMKTKLPYYTNCRIVQIGL